MSSLAISPIQPFQNITSDTKCPNITELEATASSDCEKNQGLWKNSPYEKYFTEENRQRVAARLCSLVHPAADAAQRRRLFIPPVQREVLKYSALGYSPEAISSISGSALGTIGTHKDRLSKFFNIRGQMTPLVAIITGLIGPLDILNRFINHFIQKEQYEFDQTSEKEGSENLGILGNFIDLTKKNLDANEIPASSKEDIDASATYWTPESDKEKKITYSLFHRRKIALYLHDLIRQLKQEERDILRLKSLGYTEEEVGEKAGKTKKSVSGYMNRMFRELGESKSSLMPLMGFLYGLVGPKDMLNRIIESLGERGKLEKWGLKPRKEVAS